MNSQQRLCTNKYLHRITATCTAFIFILLFASCGNTTPYSAKTIKGKMERKYNIKGQVKIIDTEEISNSTNKYFFENTETGKQFYAIASLRSNYTSFFPWTRLLGDSKVYSDSYESLLMMDKRAEALALAKKYNIVLIPTDTAVHKVYDKIYMNSSEDIEPTTQLIFDLCALYDFPQRKSSDIDAHVRIYRTIDDTIPPHQKPDKDYTFTISYSSVSPKKAKELEQSYSDLQRDMQAVINWEYTKPYLR